MTQLISTVLEFLKHAAVEKFMADITKNLLDLLIEWIEDLLRARMTSATTA